VRCAGEDSKFIDGQFFWRTPANLTAGKRFKKNWRKKGVSGLLGYSQAIESAQRWMSNAQRAGNQPSRRGSADRFDFTAFRFERGLVAISQDGGKERRLTFHHSCHQAGWSVRPHGISMTPQRVGIFTG
jgi:hypothetical protein